MLRKVRIEDSRRYHACCPALWWIFTALRQANTRGHQKPAAVPPSPSACCWASPRPVSGHGELPVRRVLPGDHPRPHRRCHQGQGGPVAGPEGKRHHRQADSRRYGHEALHRHQPGRKLLAGGGSAPPAPRTARRSRAGYSGDMRIGRGFTAARRKVSWLIKAAGVDKNTLAAFCIFGKYQPLSCGSCNSVWRISPVWAFRIT